MVVPYVINHEPWIQGYCPLEKLVDASNLLQEMKEEE